MKYANTFPSIFILAPPLSLLSLFTSLSPLLPFLISIPAGHRAHPRYGQGCAGPSNQGAVVYTAHRPPQWCGHNPNASHKLGLTASKILALKKLYKEICTAHLRSFYGVWGKKPGNQQSTEMEMLCLKLLLLREHFSLTVFFCQQNCCYYYFILLCKIIITAFNLLPFVMLVLVHH